MKRITLLQDLLFQKFFIMVNTSSTVKNPKRIAVIGIAHGGQKMLTMPPDLPASSMGRRRGD
jgi:hypothetical protein